MTAFIIRITGIVLVAGSVMMVGNYIIFGYQKRIKELESLKKAMVMLKNEIAYSASTLEECFLNIAERCMDQQVAEFFNKAALKLSDTNTKSMKLIWEECICEEMHHMHLNDEDIAELKTLGMGLGYLDKKMQTDVIELYMSVTDNTLKNASDELSDKCRVTRVLSMACGAFICILLI